MNGATSRRFPAPANCRPTWPPAYSRPGNAWTPRWLPTAASSAAASKAPRPGSTSLLWREFYKHILVGYPRVSRHRPFREETEALRWRQAPAELEAWQQGRTGIPIIDAAMRQLLATGWMHNRLRMVVAMFLSKNLLIDWREGERWFMRHLIDGDLAANNGGWQWSASTGTDAVPYFRLFNPLSQSERFDPRGEFIRHWLPELAAWSARRSTIRPAWGCSPGSTIHGRWST